MKLKFQNSKEQINCKEEDPDAAVWEGTEAEDNVIASGDQQRLARPSKKGRARDRQTKERLKTAGCALSSLSCS